tara:strand:+ start:8457 stop:8720 length:264 start_codon:yes stop_codon:yes gene_type:complete
MSWEDILKESRLEKLRSVMKKYYDDEYVEWVTDYVEEETVDEFIKHEIGEIKANLASVPKDGKFSDGGDATYYVESGNNLIKELEQI